MKLFLDACAIIYWVELSQPGYQKFNRVLQNLRKKYTISSFVASHLSLLECRVKPLQDKDEKLLRQYRDFFCATDLAWVPLSLEVIEAATRLRAFYRVRTPDAIQAASALSLSEDVIFVTGDQQFKKIPQLNLALIEG